MQKFNDDSAQSIEGAELLATNKDHATDMTALTVEQLIERIISDYKAHYDFPQQGESHMRDCLADALATLPERGGEAVAIVERETNDSPVAPWWYEIQSSVRLEIGNELFTRPQAGQEVVHPTYGTLKQLVTNIEANLIAGDTPRIGQIGALHWFANQSAQGGSHG